MATLDQYPDTQLAAIADGAWHLTPDECREILGHNTAASPNPWPWPGTSDWDALPMCLVETTARLVAGHILAFRMLDLIRHALDSGTPEPPNLDK